MSYTNSPLVDCTCISANRTSPRAYAITKITIHHMAGNLSAETCGGVFRSPARQASSNYGIDSQGRVGLYVEERDMAWTSCNWENDNRAVTIEVANDGGTPDWHVSDTALDKLVVLCADICRRNGIQRLNYTGDKSGNLTMHKWFWPTACPGPYLESKFPEIARRVNDLLESDSEEYDRCAVDLPTLHRGSEGVHVRTLQYLLRLHGAAETEEKSAFGPRTEAAVTAWQRQSGLEVDGIVGEQTWTALLS